jgi:hypothetical protein
MSAPLRGYLLKFESARDLLDAVRILVDQGYRRLEAYTPFPVAGLEDKLPPARNPLAALILLGGVLGGVLGYAIQYYTAVIDYPILAGGKPMHSWPAFLPVTFELIILGGALAGFLGALWCNGLPRLHHPLFEVAEFAQASRDRFFLLIDAADERFARARTRRELEALPAAKIIAVNLE